MPSTCILATVKRTVKYFFTLGKIMCVHKTPPGKYSIIHLYRDNSLSCARSVEVHKPDTLDSCVNSHSTVCLHNTIYIIILYYSYMYKEATTSNSKLCKLKIKLNKSLLLETDGEVRTCKSSRTPNHKQQFHYIFSRSVYSVFAPQIVAYINIIVT